MNATDLIRTLATTRQEFGPESAATKLDLLGRILDARRLTPRQLVAFQESVNFMRAYPDSPALLRCARQGGTRIREWIRLLPDGGEASGLINYGLPGSMNFDVYGYGALRHMARWYPDCFEIDWESSDPDSKMSSAAEAFITLVESETQEDMACDWPEWVAEGCAPGVSELEHLVNLAEGSDLPLPLKATLFESCQFTTRYWLRHVGMGKCEVEVPVKRIAYQKRPISRERFPVEPRIRRAIPTPERLGPAAGERVLRACLLALSSRNLEIHPLLWGNSEDVRVHDAGQGLQIVFIGVLPEQRSPLAGLQFFLALKNGVPLAYGPASPFLGCCEMGINLFPEFRGVEIRRIWAAVMQVLHHVFGVEFFYLTTYGMGVGNEDAIASGAFWFYRKLGFVPSSPDVEALAREEETRMANEPGYRSDRRMLRRLAKTEAYLDLSGGRFQRFPYGELGMAVNHFVAERFQGRREHAAAACEKHAARVLGVNGWNSAERRVLRHWGPLVDLMAAGQWSSRDRSRLAKALRSKAGASEAESTRLLAAHPRVLSALLRVAAESPPTRPC